MNRVSPHSKRGPWLTSVSEEKSALLQLRTDNVLPDLLKIALKIYEIILVIFFPPSGAVRRVLATQARQRFPAAASGPRRPGSEPQNPPWLTPLCSFEAFLTRDPKAFFSTSFMNYLGISAFISRTQRFTSHGYSLGMKVKCPN